MDAVEVFAEEAGRFEAWALTSRLEGKAAVRETLRRLCSLYIAALNLPPAWSDELSLERETAAGSHRENARTALTVTSPINYYGEVFNPLLIPPEEPVIGSINDDLSDIFQEVTGGLGAFRDGKRAVAVWEWSFGFHNHWGEHATGAIRALHAWLSLNDSRT